MTTGKGGDGFTLTVLGTDGSYPAPGGACSGYLLQAGGRSVWLDAGPGTMANLQLHVGLEQLDAVVVSHAHPDHWSDLEGLYVAMRYFFNRRGVPVYAPEGLRSLMAGERPDGTFDWRTVADGSTAELGSFGFRWSRTDHPVETLACRVDAMGRSLVYSADTGTGWELSSLGPGPSLAVVEASLPPEEEGAIQHLSARQAAEAALRAGAERLLLSHLGPTVDREQARRLAVAVFGERVDLAEVGKTWQV